MALEVSFIRTLKGLEPADDEAREALKTWKLGQAVKGTFTRQQENPHRRYWYGLVQLVLDNTDLYHGNKDACADSIKLSVGHVNQTQVYENGQWRIERSPKTVAGKALNEVEWRDLNRRTERFICEILCVDEQMLASAMEQYLAPGLHREGNTKPRRAA